MYYRPLPCFAEMPRESSHFFNTFSRESKYEIKGSKSRSVREKNVLYSNLKNAIYKVFHDANFEIEVIHEIGTRIVNMVKITLESTHFGA